MDPKTESGVRAVIHARRSELLDGPAVLSYYIPEFNLGAKTGQGALVLDSFVTIRSPEGFALWREGLHLVRCAFDGERKSFIDPIFRSMQPKLSFEFLSVSSDTPGVSRIAWDEKLRTVRIEFGGPQIPLSNESEEKDLGEAVQLGELITRSYEWSQRAFARCNQALIESHVNALQAAIPKDVEPFKDPAVAEVLRVGFAFALPSQRFPTKAFTALVVPSHVLKGEEITYEGLVVFWNPSAAGRPTWLGEDLLVWTALLSVQRTTKLLLGRSAEEARTAARGAVMARNMSHNLGSHVIAGLDWTRLRAYGDLEGGRPVETFLGYVQQRMDFLARVATEWPQWREPTLFIRDLVGTFTGQRVVLDKLASERGLAHSTIEFEVFTRRTDEPAARPVQVPSQSDCDFLIGIPGGLVGRQAFFGFLENVIRNAAIHGNRRDRLKIYIQLEEKGDPQKIECIVADNFSDRKVPIETDGNSVLIEPWKAIHQMIQEDLVDQETGELTRHHWGVQEMKVCADFLGGGRLPRNPHLRAEEYTPPVVAVEPVLAYRIDLIRANLVAVAGMEPPRNADNLSRFGVGWLTRSVGTEEFVVDVRKHAPGLLYIAMPEDTTEHNKAVKWLAERRHQLPARILLGVSAGSIKGSSEASESRLPLPGSFGTNRVGIKPNPGETEMRTLILKLYWEWVSKLADRHRAERPFNVLIGFDRDHGLSLKRWEPLKAEVEELGTPIGHEQRSLVNAFLLWNDAGASVPSKLAPWQSTGAPLRTCPALSQVQGCFILFDNHGFLSDGPARDVQHVFRHVISRRGSSPTGEPYDNNASVFQRISNPAQGHLGLVSLLQIIEASLLRVLIIDERISELFWEVRGQRCVTKNPVAQRDFSNARLAAVPFVKVGRRLFSTVPAAAEPESRDEMPCLTIDGTDAQLEPVENPNAVEGPRFDFVIVHLRQLQRFASEIRSEDFLRALHKVAVRVVITSGRGNLLEGDLAQQPFLEFSVLEACVVKELDKIQLGNVLMSII